MSGFEMFLLVYVLIGAAIMITIDEIDSRRNPRPPLHIWVVSMIIAIALWPVLVVVGVVLAERRRP